MSAQHTGLFSREWSQISLTLPEDLQCALLPATILGMEKLSPGGSPAALVTAREPFLPGALVIATLSNPREKFWGMILALAPEGLSLSGAELASFEDLAVMVRDGEPFTPAVVFFPMHRIERVELDLPDGNLPSLSQRFFAKTGLQPSAALAPSNADAEKARNEEPRAAARALKGRA
jgi:hypothetical protein